MELNQWDKLLIIAIASGVVTLVLIFTVCVVTPFCCFTSCHSNDDTEHQSENGSTKSKKKSKGSYKGGKSFGHTETTPLHSILKDDIMKNKHHYQYTLGGGVIKTGEVFTGIPGISNTNNRGIRQTDSTYSSMSNESHEDIQMMSSNTPSLSVHSEIPDNDEHVISPNGKEAKNYGNLTFTICYRCAEAQTIGQLLVCIMEVEDLPPREYSGACDPYIKLTVSRCKGRRIRSSSSSSLKKMTVLSSFSTTTFRKTQHPIYNETFMAEIERAELNDCVVKFEVFDDDKCANDTLLCEFLFRIKDLKIAQNEPPLTHSVDMCEPKLNYGELLLGISYLPTAERLTLNVIKANNLKNASVLTSPLNNHDSLSTFIRVLLIHNGRVIKRKKTSFKKQRSSDEEETEQAGMGLSPKFEETVTFDVPLKEIENVSIIVLVCIRNVKDPAATESESDFSSPEGTFGRQQSHGSRSKSQYIGKVVLGKTVNSNSARQHWFAMLQTPRKQLTQWHTLY